MSNLNIDHAGIASIYTSSNGKITISDGGCGCCAEYKDHSPEEAIKAIDEEVAKLLTIRALLAKEKS